jgi:hypothetical protein
MIGVIADTADHEIVREFFELFKTPWEFYQNGKHYDVLLCAGECQLEADAKLLVVYAGRKLEFDSQDGSLIVLQLKGPRVLSYREDQIPIYGNEASFVGRTGWLTDKESGACTACLHESVARTCVRVGYDLFQEVRALLTTGQPVTHAGIPTLELHIAVLRGLMIGCGISFVEIPPVPEGYQFIACLTHDVDHPSVRQHKWDHTLIGFLLRATFGSVIDVFRGRMPIGDATRNWTAAIKLPFVYMGLAKDFWRDFDDRYLELEGDLPSTFFLIPYKGIPGRGVDSRAKALRASPYEAKELTDTICKLQNAGREIGLHGIDAWIDRSAACDELEEVRRLTGVAEKGVRMHWLYYKDESPAILERAGAVYDSTIGYNETVGCRAGTTQVYKPLGAVRLLEVPLHVMDTALFYLSYLGLSPRKASARLHQMVNDFERFGGCLTINWHDRSLAPERLWGGVYRELIQDLKRQGAWFATARQAVCWFQKRRNSKFEVNENGERVVRVEGHDLSGLPGLRLLVHKPSDMTKMREDQEEEYLGTEVKEGAQAGTLCVSIQTNLERLFSIS